MFKQNFETESYVKVIMPLYWRSALAKFRAGVAPLRLETGRYENLAVNQRTCFNCNESVKSERHVLFHCPLYDDLQYEMFSVALLHRNSTVARRVTNDTSEHYGNP